MNFFYKTGTFLFLMIYLSCVSQLQSAALPPQPPQNHIPLTVPVKKHTFNMHAMTQRDMIDAHIYNPTDPCGVCFSELGNNPNDPILALHCSPTTYHSFHAGCIIERFSETSIENQLCPNCLPQNSVIIKQFQRILKLLNLRHHKYSFSFLGQLTLVALVCLLLDLYRTYIHLDSFNNNCLILSGLVFSLFSLFCFWFVLAQYTGPYSSYSYPTKIRNLLQQLQNSSGVIELMYN